MRNSGGQVRRVIFPNSVTKIIWVGREVKVKSNGVQCKEEEKYFEILDIHGNFLTSSFHV